MPRGGGSHRRLESCRDEGRNPEVHEVQALYPDRRHNAAPAIQPVHKIPCGASWGTKRFTNFSHFVRVAIQTVGESAWLTEQPPNSYQATSTMTHVNRTHDDARNWPDCPCRVWEGGKRV